jgi:outer membrane protein assembly factor BamB
MIPKKVKVIVVLALLLFSSVFASSSLNHSTASAQTSTSNAVSSSVLNQYEWPQFQGDGSATRFSNGPGPSTSAILWKANITGIQSYIAAFDGLIFVCTNTSAVALTQSGSIAWQTPVNMVRNWPIAYEIDSTHMIVESTCLDPTTGAILWTSSQFCADTGIFDANVYSPETQMFYIKVGSDTQAWDFSDPSKPPTLVWDQYVPGGVTTGIGTTYGDGLVFVGSSLNEQIALNATTGAVVWTTLTKGPMIFNGAYSDGMFFRGGTDDNTMYCFNATTGQIIWTYTPQGDDDGYFVTGPAIGYGMVYEMNKDGYFYALDMQTGSLVWKYKGPDSTLLWPGMPSIADGMVYVTTGESAEYGGQVGTSQFACLNAYTGQIIWTLPIEALAPRESVAIAYGNLYMIPGNVTTSVDSITGNEYSRVNQIWCIGSNSIPVSNWPMWRADPTHSSTAQEGPATLALSWKFATNGSVVSSPTVVNGIVYFGSEDKNIYAVGAWSGQLIWNFTTKDVVESTPAVADGKVYTGGDDGYVYCLDANNGSLIWQTFVNGDLQFTFGDIVLKSSPAVVNGIVYIGSLDGYMYALNANTGAVVWTHQTLGPIESSPAVADGAVFFTSQEPATGMLYKLDANTGVLLWKQQLPYEYQFTGGDEMMSSPSVADGMVFTSANIRTYYAINEATGAYVWNFTDPAATEFIYLAPIYVNGTIFIIDKYDITCLNATSADTIWSFYTGDELYIAPTYANGLIYDVTSERHIFILNASNKGAELDKATTPSSSWSSPTIANGELYIGCNDWNLYCYTSAVPGQVISTSPSTSPGASSGVNGTYLTAAIVVIALILIVGVVAVALISIQRPKKPAATSP